MVYQFLQKQTERPFLKRYLKRDEILRQISACDASLSDSVSAFSVRFLPFWPIIIIIIIIIIMFADYLFWLASYQSRSVS
jgi:hypothetical protein